MSFFPEYDPTSLTNADLHMAPCGPASRKVFRLPPVYPITDKKLAGRKSHFAIVRELVRGGTTLIQIRDKETPVGELLTDLCRCSEFCQKHEVLVLVNDRCDLALSSAAAGVHLGQGDLPAQAARRLLGGGMIIGLSTHSLAELRQANVLPVDYIGFGPVFATATKGNASPVVGISGLRHACREADRPVVAIGGIGMGQIKNILDAGASSAAVISALMKADHPARTMERMLKLATAR